MPAVSPRRAIAAILATVLLVSAAAPAAVAQDDTGVSSEPVSIEVALGTLMAAGEATFYTVKSGDTLGKIAQELYGSASKYTVIFEANQPMLKDPDKIYPGQSLRIPAL